MNNVLVITYWSFSDALIQAYTLPYIRMIRKQLPTGSTTWLLTLEKKSASLNHDERSKIEARLLQEGIFWIPFKYRSFGVGAFLMWLGILARLLKLIMTHRISTIHCWATPAGAMGYLLSVLSGKSLIIDSYEPHAESMVENGTWKRGSLAFRLLFWLERKQSQRARALISATEGMRSYAKEKYGARLQKFWVKPACVDLSLFSPSKIKNPLLLSELDLTGKIVCVYAGKLGGIYLQKEVFEFFRVAQDFWGDRFRIILLSSHIPAEMIGFCQASGVEPSIIRTMFVPHNKVPEYMGLGDFALTPVKPVPTKRFCTPIKDGEYWALGLPVVIPANISDDSEIIERNNAGAVLYSLDMEQYLKAVQKIDSLLKEDHLLLFSRINRLAVQYRSFQIAEDVYQKVYGGGFE